MARHRQLAATAQSETVHRGDNRLAQPLDTAKDGLSIHRAGLAIERPLAGEVTDVGSRDERLGARSGEDHPAHCPVRLDRLECLSQLGDDRVVQCIELVGAVDGDERDGFAEVQ